MEFLSPIIYVLAALGVISASWIVVSTANWGTYWLKHRQWPLKQEELDLKKNQELYEQKLQVAETDRDRAIHERDQAHDDLEKMFQKVMDRI